eukprot:gene15665-17903_t
MLTARVPVCLNDKIVKTGCYCLNESPGCEYINLFGGDHTLGVRSDTDEQLIIHVLFLQTFQLDSIVFGVPGDGSCPATVKLFCNVSHFGFSDANDTPATQVAQLAPLVGSPSHFTVNLQAVKWNRVNSLTIFIENNHGAETTYLHGLQIFGTPMDIKRGLGGIRFRVDGVDVNM